MKVEDILTCFEDASGEEELWNKFARVANDEFGVTSILYGFTHNKFTAVRLGITKSIYMRHNHPDGYVNAFESGAFLDCDPCATRLFETGGSLVCDVYADNTRESRMRQEIGRGYNMDVGVTLGLTFAGGLGIAGAGLSAGSQRPKEFHDLWAARRRDIEALFCAFDARLRPSMVASRMKLSPRERDVIAYAAGGLTGKEIAFRLGIKPKSVFNTMERARDALEASTTFEAIAKAYAYNLI
ncbi:MAG: autoinducer binding domain-containing protein [Rhodoblastus sp.]|nr:MAG: autoinducer binding domain-containing protein [Rhodoblastus sp.]